jgi:hypothetical protein
MAFPPFRPPRGLPALFHLDLLACAAPGTPRSPVPFLSQFAMVRALPPWRWSLRQPSLSPSSPLGSPLARRGRVTPFLSPLEFFPAFYGLSRGGSLPLRCVGDAFPVRSLFLAARASWSAGSPRLSRSWPAPRPASRAAFPRLPGLPVTDVLPGGGSGFPPCPRLSWSGGHPTTALCDLRGRLGRAARSAPAPRRFAPASYLRVRPRPLCVLLSPPLLTFAPRVDQTDPAACPPSGLGGGHTRRFTPSCHRPLRRRPMTRPWEGWPQDRVLSGLLADTNT